MRSVFWAELTRDELAAAATADHLVIVPTGTTGQHGHHLPVDVDVHCATEIARRVALEVVVRDLGKFLRQYRERQALAEGRRP